MRTRPFVGSLHPASMPGLIVDRFYCRFIRQALRRELKPIDPISAGFFNLGHREPDATPWSLGGEIIAGSLCRGKINLRTPQFLIGARPVLPFRNY